jgi:hypothetical protein
MKNKNHRLLGGFCFLSAASAKIRYKPNHKQNKEYDCENNNGSKIFKNHTGHGGANNNANGKCK